MSEPDEPSAAPSWEQVAAGRSVERKRAGLLVDTRRCIGCHACAVACKTENDVALGGFRIRTHYVPRPDRPIHAFVPMTCMQCQDAPCIPACPNKAIRRESDGRVEISPNDCTTNEECTKACPYGAIHVDPQTRKADKCNLCPQRTEVGLEPACVDACPTHALRFGDFDDTESDVSRLAAKESARSFRAEAGTKPTVQYVGLTDWMEEGAKRVQLFPGESGLIYEQGA